MYSENELHDNISDRKETIINWSLTILNFIIVTLLSVYSFLLSNEVSNLHISTSSVSAIIRLYLLYERVD